jgi:hypothetical protein
MPTRVMLYRYYDTLVKGFHHLTEAAGSPRFAGATRLVRLIGCVYALTLVAPRSPRFYYTQSDFMGMSFWACLRDSDRRDGALMRFLGFPWFLFLQLVAACEEVVGPEAVLGRPSRFSILDLTAIALRRFQSRGTQENLQIDFGCNKATLSRALKFSLDMIARAVETFQESAIRYPTLDEGAGMWSGVTSHFGLPPADNIPMIVTTIDGTVTRVLKPAVDEVQRLFYSGRKGHGLNHVLVKDMYGCVCDAVICAPGVSIELLLRHCNAAR